MTAIETVLAIAFTIHALILICIFWILIRDWREKQEAGRVRKYADGLDCYPFDKSFDYNKPITFETATDMHPSKVTIGSVWDPIKQEWID